MKMQNTEMEFVTFAAQDVIATSGGLTGYYGLQSYSKSINATNFKDSTKGVKFTNEYANLGEGFTSGTFYILTSTTSLPKANVNYAVTGIKKVSNRLEFVYTLESDFLEKNPGAAGNNLYSSSSETSVTEILNWLVTNQSLIVQ